MTERPASAIVFCNTRADTRDVAESLDRCGFSVLALHGDLDQRERDEMLVRFANHSCTILVATDVAARGLDIKELPLVVNYDVASDADAHVHRIGRTGRAGKHGDATSLFSPEESQRLADIEKLIKRKIERVEISGFAELVSAPVERAPSNRGHKREHLERAREKARERDRSLTMDGSKPAGRELPRGEEMGAGAV